MANMVTPDAPVRTVKKVQVKIPKKEVQKMKVRLVRGTFWKDRETGFSIHKGEIKEVEDEEIIKRSNGRLQVLVNLERENED